MSELVTCVQLWTDRTFTGATPGGMESWLLLRSLRTLHVVSIPPGLGCSSSAQDTARTPASRDRYRFSGMARPDRPEQGERSRRRAG